MTVRRWSDQDSVDHGPRDDHVSGREAFAGCLWFLVGPPILIGVAAGLFGLCAPPGVDPGEDGTKRPTVSSPAALESTPAVLTPEELAAGSATYTIHEVNAALSFTHRDRVAAEVTTPETEPDRVVEALMRAAIDVHRANGLPFAVMVRLWDTWPTTEVSAQRHEVYALDGCGWAGEPAAGRVRCDGPIWTLEVSEIPAWILRDSPGVLTDPRQNGWALRVW